MGASGRSGQGVETNIAVELSSKNLETLWVQVVRVARAGYRIEGFPQPLSPDFDSLIPDLFERCLLRMA